MHGKGMKGVTISRNGVPVRLPWERWGHIVEGHADLGDYQDEVLDTVGNPDEVRKGYGGTLIALWGYGKRGYLAVIYKEVSRLDGFIVTARFVYRKPGGRKAWGGKS